jgi:hypothetical protein
MVMKSLNVYQKDIDGFNSGIILLKNELKESLMYRFLNFEFKSLNELLKHIEFLLKSFEINHLYITKNKKVGIDIGGVNFYKNPYQFIYGKNKVNYDKNKEIEFFKFCLQIVKHKQIIKVSFNNKPEYTSVLNNVYFHTNLK